MKYQHHDGRFYGPHAVVSTKHIWTYAFAITHSFSEATGATDESHLSLVQQCHPQREVSTLVISYSFPRFLSRSHSVSSHRYPVA